MLDIINFIEQLQSCERLNKFDRTFIKEMLVLFPQLAKSLPSTETVDSKIKMLSDDLDVIDGITDNESKSAPGSSKVSEFGTPDEFDFDEEILYTPIYFKSKDSEEIEALDWLRIFQARSNAILDDPAYDYTYIYLEESNQFWLKFYFHTVVKLEPTADFFNTFFPTLRHRREPNTLFLYKDCIQCNIFILEKFPIKQEEQKQLYNSFVFNEEFDRFCYINHTGGISYYDIDDEDLTDFKSRLNLLMRGLKSVISALTLNALLGEYNQFPRLDLRQFILSADNTSLYYLPAYISRIESGHQFANLAGFDLHESPILPREFYRIRSKYNLYHFHGDETIESKDIPVTSMDYNVRIYAGNKQYANIWTYIAQELVEQWQNFWEYSPKLCAQLPTTDPAKSTLYLEARPTAFKYLVFDHLQKKRYQFSIKSAATIIKDQIIYLSNIDGYVAYSIKSLAGVIEDVKTEILAPVDFNLTELNARKSAIMSRLLINGHLSQSYEGEIPFNRLQYQFTLPVTEEQVLACLEKIEYEVYTNGHTLRRPDFPKHLLPILIELIDHYFLTFEKATGDAIAQLRTELTAWSMLLKRYGVVKDANYLYGQIIEIKETQSKCYLYKIFADCYDDNATNLNYKLLAIVRWLTDYDAEFACVAQSNNLKEFYQNLHVGQGFNTNVLASILINLSENCSIEIKHKLDELGTFLESFHRRSKPNLIIDEKIKYFLDEIFQMRANEKRGRYTQHNGEDYWWIRLAQLLAGAGYLNTHYIEFLDPNFVFISFEVLSRWRRDLHGELFFTYNNNVYEIPYSYLERPIVIAWQKNVNLPKYLFKDLVKTIDVYCQVTTDISMLSQLRKQFADWQLNLQGCALNERYLLYTQLIDIENTSTYLLYILLDLYDWLKCKQITLLPESLTKKILALANWLSQYDPSLIGEHHLLQNQYQQLGVGWIGFSKQKFYFCLTGLLASKCTEAIRQDIHHLQAVVQQKENIDHEVLFRLCSIYHQHRQSMKTAYHLDINNDEQAWVYLARCLEGAGYFKPYKIHVGSVTDVLENTLYFTRRDGKLCYQVKTPAGNVVVKDIPELVIHLKENKLERYEQLEPYLTTALYYITAAGDILPQNAYGLLYWPLNQYYDYVSRESITNMHLQDCVLNEAGTELIILPHCVSHFKAKKTFCYASGSESKLLTPSETGQIMHTKFATYLHQEEFLQQSQSLCFNEIMALYLLVNEALYSVGLKHGPQFVYNQKQSDVAKKAFDEFIKFYQALPPIRQQVMNKQRIVFAPHVNLSLAEVIDGRWRCMATTCKLLSIPVVQYGSFKFRTDLENDSEKVCEFSKIRQLTPIKTIADLDQVVRRANLLLVDIMTRSFQPESNRGMSGRQDMVATLWDHSNKLNLLSKRMYEALSELLYCDDSNRIAQIYIQNIISEIITPTLYDKLNISKETKEWLVSILNDSFYSQYNFYEAEQLFNVLIPHAFSQDSSARLIQEFLDAVIQTIIQSERQQLINFRINIKFNLLMKQHALTNKRAQILIELNNRGKSSIDPKAVCAIVMQYVVQRVNLIGTRHLKAVKIGHFNSNDAEIGLPENLQHQLSQANNVKELIEAMKKMLIAMPQQENTNREKLVYLTHLTMQLPIANLRATTNNFRRPTY